MEKDQKKNNRSTRGGHIAPIIGMWLPEGWKKNKRRTTGHYSYYWRFTFYRLVTKTNKIHHGKILGHAKNCLVISFGLVDIVIIYLRAVPGQYQGGTRQKTCFSSDECGDQPMDSHHHAIQLPPSLRVGQQLGDQLQPVLVQLPLQPPAQGGYAHSDQALHKPHHALQLPPSPRVGQQLGDQLESVLGQLPLQPPAHVGQQLVRQIQPVLGRLPMQPPAQGGNEHGLLVSTLNLVQRVAKLHDPHLKGFKEMYFLAIPLPSAFSSSPAPSFSGCFLGFLGVSHHISSEIQLQTHSLSFICLPSFSSKAGFQTTSSHLVTIWQGLIVGDGDGVGRPGAEERKITARANCLHRSCVLAVYLAALSKFRGCKTHFFVSWFISLLANGATPSNFGAASFLPPSHHPVNIQEAG